MTDEPEKKVLDDGTEVYSDEPLTPKENQQFRELISTLAFEKKFNKPDKKKKVFRRWYFDSNGWFLRSDTTGRWNPDTETLTWTTDMGEGRTQTITNWFLDKDTIKCSIVVKDKQETTLLDIQGTSTRYKEKK